MKTKWHHAQFMFTELQKPLNLEEPHDELSDFDTRFYLILRKHLVILAWWSLFNIVGGIIAALFTQGVYYYFWMMGIDTTYIFVGLLLREHSFVCEVTHRELWLGFGWSIIIQGLFLFIQDIWITRLHHINYKMAQPYFEILLGRK